MSFVESSSEATSLKLPTLAQFAIHDLKGAAHAIQGFLSVLQSEQAGPLTETQRDFISSAFITARRIERLVEDLQVFELGQQSMSLIPQECNLLTVIRMCLKELEPTALGFSVDVQIQADLLQNWNFIADPVRLEQIAFNMIENAIRYSEANSTVVVRLRSSPSRLLLVVQNQVADPDNVNVARWFEPFKRGHNEAQPDRRGLGIGLTVVKTMVGAHGGTVVGRVRGTTVSIAAILPRRPQTVGQPTNR